MNKIAYSVREASGLIGIGKTKLYEMIKSSEVPVVRIGGRTLVRHCDLEVLLERYLISS